MLTRLVNAANELHYCAFFDNRFKSSFNKKKKSGIHIYKFNCLHCKKEKEKVGNVWMGIMVALALNSN